MMLKFKLALLTICLLCFARVKGQDYPMTTGTITTCTGLFFDDGTGGSYSTTSYTFTICPDVPGNVIQVDFSAFSLWTSPNPNSSDRLFIYDGPNVGSATLGSYTGNQLQGVQVTGTINNPTGCLTFVFQANPNGNTQGIFPGWEAIITCTTPCASPVSAAEITSPAPSGLEQSIGSCIGDPITFSDAGSFAQPGFTIDSYIWNLGDGTFDSTTGSVVTHTYDEPGEYIVTLTVVDNNGCSSINLFPLQVLVSTIPIFNTEFDSEICLGETVTLNGSNIESTYWTSLPPQVVAGTTYLADGAGFSYSTSLTFDFFEPNAVLENCDDFLGFYVNMEHSYLGDLSMQLECPNGTVVNILNFPNGGGGTFLGEPVDDPQDLPGQNVEGIGYTYTWTPTATNGNINNQPNNQVTYVTTTGITVTNNIVPEGTYQPLGNLCNFVGCPLNGSWTFTITDNLAADNGYIFYWGIDFNPNYFPDVTTFTPVIGMNADSSYWTGPNITSVSTDGNVIVFTPDAVGQYEFTYFATNNFGCLQDTTVVITVVPGPEADAGPDIVICDEEGQLEGSVSGLPQPDPTCTYTIQMFDTFGDGWNGFSVTILQNSVSLGNFTIPFGANGNASFTVNHGSTIQINTTSGTWNSEVSYIIYNSAGDVFFEDYGTNTSATPILIGNNIFTGTADCQPGVPDYIFQWTPEEGLSDPTIANPTVMVDQTTTYTLTVWEPGHPLCASSDEVIVSIPPEVDPGLDTEITLCYNEPTFNLTETLDGTPVSTGVWTDAGGNNIPIDFSPFDYPNGGTFVYTYTTTFQSCVKQATLTITVIEAGNDQCCQTFANAGLDEVVCDLTTQLTALPVLGNGYWSGPDWVQFANENNPTTLVTATAPGGVAELIWMDDNGFLCTETDTVQIVFSIPMQVEIFSLPASCPDTCNAVALAELVGGLGEMNFQWSQGESTNLPFNQMGLCEGPVTVDVEDEFGCSATFTSIITELPRPSIQNIGSYAATCAGLCDGRVVVTSQDATSVSFDGGLSFNTVFDYDSLCPGIIQVEVRNDLNCPNFGTALIEEPLPVVANFNMAPSPTTWENTTVQFNDLSYPEPIVYYEWVFDTLNILGTSNEANPTYTFPVNTAGTYPVSLYVENINGCSDYISFDLHVYETLALYIPNSFTPNDDGLNDLFKAYASNDQLKDYRMTIFDRFGEKVFESEDINQGWNGGFVGSTYYVQNDVYVYQVEVTSTITQEKLEYKGHLTIIR